MKTNHKPLPHFWQQRTAEVGDGEVSNPIAHALKADAEERFAELKQVQRVNLTMEIVMIFVFVVIVAAVCL
jgi:hypothetical protein